MRPDPRPFLRIIGNGQPALRSAREYPRSFTALHQSRNADMMMLRGAAVDFEQKKLLEGEYWKLFVGIVATIRGNTDESKLSAAKLRAGALAAAVDDAASRVADEVEKAAR